MNTYAFIGNGLIIAFLIWIITNSHIINLFKILISISLVCAFIFLTFVSSPLPTLSTDGPLINLTPYKEIIFYCFMIIGILFRMLSKAIDDYSKELKKWQKDKGNQKPKVEFDPWVSVVNPIILSVASFGLLLSQIRSQKVTLMSLILCFETGFFWQTTARKNLLKTLVNKVGISKDN